MGIKIVTISALLLVVGGQRCDFELEPNSLEKSVLCYGVYSIGDLEKLTDDRPVKVQVINKPQDRFYLQSQDSNADASNNFFDHIKELDLSKAGQLISNTSNSQGFAQLTSLKTLSVSNSNLSNFESTWFPIPNQIIDFNAAGNDLKELSFVRDLVSLPNLKRLDLTRNFINNISFASDNQIETLILNDNQVYDLDFLPLLTQLRELQVKNNDLTLLRKNQFANANALEVVDFAKNFISSVEPGSFDSITKLRSVNLSHNSLENINIFTLIANLKFIENLDFSYNEVSKLKELGFLKLSNLRSLNLSHNFIDTLPEKSLSGLFCLRELYLDSNQLASIPKYSFNQLYFLEYLDLSSNQLTELDPVLFASGGRMLKRLFLANNKLQSLHENIFRNTRHLVQLDLSNNQLKSLPNFVFSQLSSLKILHLNHNSLEQFSMKLVENSRQLRVIFLNSNRLTFVGDLDDKMLNALKKLSILTIDQNPWQCSCMDETMATLKRSMINYQYESNYFDGGKQTVCIVIDECYKNLNAKHENQIRELFYKRA